MSLESTGDSPMSVVEAARTLFRASTPSDEQILRVCRLMRTGALRPRERAGPAMHWTTTPTALAEFLAASAVQRTTTQQPEAREQAEPAQMAEEADGIDDPPSPAPSPDTASGRAPANNWDDPSGVYREIWRDYFLAMLLRRRTDRHGAAFQRAVVIGQGMVLFALVSVLVATVFGISSLCAPAGNEAVLRLIDASTDDYSITRWHAAAPHPAGEGELIRVEYRYRKESNRWIQTERTFHVTGNSAVEVGLDEDA